MIIGDNYNTWNNTTKKNIKFRLDAIWNIEEKRRISSEYEKMKEKRHKTDHMADKSKMVAVKNNLRENHKTNCEEIHGEVIWNKERKLLITTEDQLIR